VLSLKNGFALEFFTVLKYFLSCRIFEKPALALKNRDALKFFTVFEHVFLSFRIFEQLALALKNRVAPEIFSPYGIYFYIQEFLSNLRFP